MAGERDGAESGFIFWPGQMHSVVAVPDEKKREQLVLFSTVKDADRPAVLNAFQELGLSELAVPKKINILEEIPLTGTGKTDYVRLNEMARN